MNLGDLLSALDPKNAKGQLIIARSLKEGSDTIVVNDNLLIRVVKIKGKQVKLAFRDLKPGEYNMIDRGEVYLNRLLKESQEASSEADSI